MTLIKRLVKGSKLTHEEMDGNLDHLVSLANSKAPATHSHSADQVSETSGKQFVSSSQKDSWNDKQSQVKTINIDGSSATAEWRLKDGQSASLELSVSQCTISIDEGDAETGIYSLEVGQSVGNQNIAFDSPLVRTAKAELNIHQINGTRTKLVFFYDGAWFDLISTVTDIKELNP